MVSVKPIKLSSAFKTFLQCPKYLFVQVQKLYSSLFEIKFAYLLSKKYVFRTNMSFLDYFKTVHWHKNTV